MADNQRSELAAKRWAKALIELINEDSNLSKDQILQDVSDIAETIATSEELSSVILNPSVSTEEKQIVLCKLFQDKVTPVVYNFIYVLNLKKRINIIGLILEEFKKELEKIQNITHVDITSAIELDDGKKDNIKYRVAEKLKKDIIVNWTVDNDIIAGLVFNINDTVVDNSVKHKLDSLSREIIKS